MHKQLSIGATDPSYARGHGLLRPAEAAVGAVLAATLLGGCSAANPSSEVASLPSVEAGASNDAEVLRDEARRLAGAILANIPSDMVCSPSCRVGTMNDPTERVAPGMPEYKYEVDMYGDDGLVQVIATQAEPNPDEVRGDGISVLFTVDQELIADGQTRLTAGELARLVADPTSTDAASLHIHNDGWFTTVRAVEGAAGTPDSTVEIRWGMFGPEGVSEVQSPDDRFMQLYIKALGNAAVTLGTVDRVAAGLN